jgi:ketosteroid isomerase-like protein
MTMTSELIALERQYWQAIQDGDFDKIGELTDDPCIVTGAQGLAQVDRPTLERMLVNAPWILHSFELSGEQGRMISDDVAVLAYKVRERLTVDGKPLTLEANDSSTWVRRDGRWLCALHTEAIAGDPFGRDRRTN